MSATPPFKANERLLLLGSLRSALQAVPALAMMLASAERYTLVPEQLPHALGRAESLAAIKLASVATPAAAQQQISWHARQLCCADFAQIRVEPNGLLVLAIGDAAGADTLHAAQLQKLREFFSELQIDSFQITPGQWVLALPAHIATPNALAPSQLLGRALNALMPEPAIWARLLNESQMLFAELAASSTQQLAPNSFWFYAAQSKATERAAQTKHAPLGLQLEGASADPMLQGLAAMSQPAKPRIYAIDARATAIDEGLISTVDWLSFDSGVCFRRKPWRERWQRAQFWRPAGFWQQTFLAQEHKKDER
jgi:hypothetical protein